jgi:aminoglycoside phosphotransferase (APT) family kinase protein/transcription elongation GreA/GreB family factor
MLLDANRLLTGLAHEFNRLQAQLGDRNIDGSAAQAIANAIQLLKNRERGDVGLAREQLNRLDRVLAQLADTLEHADNGVPALLAQVRATLGAAQTAENLRRSEETWRTVLVQCQELAARVVRSSLPADSKATVSRALVAWESEDLLSQSARDAQSLSTPASVEIANENLTAYLRDRFQEPGLTVTSLQPLAGGFGKQTVLFGVQGKAMSGEFVMRRDIGIRGSVPNDCHMTKREFPVIKAAHARGFPAPDAVWVDTEHPLLPGGDFIIMRRSAGKLAGNFFGASTSIPASLVDTLADVAARLHTLPPLKELGDLTDSIRAPLWNLSMGQCSERYIRNWYELFQREQHTSSPALMGLYGWLLDNVPDRKGPPVLLHGDIGFHNFLFEGDQLSAVLDWEFAHIGDPAEEIGYIKVTVGAALDWDRLMARYQKSGGAPIDAQTLRYFQVWAYVRNATASNLVSTLFDIGEVDDLKLTILPVGHYPQFIRGAQALIDAR